MPCASHVFLTRLSTPAALTQSETVAVLTNPLDESKGSHNVNFCRVLYIDRDDFVLKAPKGEEFATDMKRGNLCSGVDRKHTHGGGHFLFLSVRRSRRLCLPQATSASRPTRPWASRPSATSLRTRATRRTAPER